MGQERRADQIADGVDAGNTGLHPFVNRNKPILRRDAQLFQAAHLGVRHPADRHQDGLARQLLTFTVARYRDPGLSCLDGYPLNACVGEDCYSLFGQGAVQKRRDLLVFIGQDRGKQLNKGDSRAIGLIDVGELYTDRSATDNNHRGRRPVQQHRLSAGEHNLAIDRDVR